MFLVLMYIRSLTINGLTNTRYCSRMIAEIKASVGNMYLLYTKWENYTHYIYINIPQVGIENS